MKLLILMITTLSITSSFNYDSIKTAMSRTEAIIDSIPNNSFYGLTAHQIINMPIKEIKKLCITKGITLSQFVIVRTKAKNYLLKEKIRHDSIETARIYKEVDELLDIDN